MIQAILRFGPMKRRIWVQLRDCDVEVHTLTGDVPSISVDGMQITPREGKGAPEIQVVNARVKL
jgi:hypothetical protein